MINIIKKHKKISLIIMIVLFIIILPFTFSKYKSNTSIKVKTTTGEIVNSISIDQNNNYIENDSSYIFININNFKIEGNTKYINDIDYNYDLIVKGKDLLFSLDNKDYKEELTYSDSFSKEENTNKIKVYVKNNYSNSNDIKVEIKASQTDMEAIE